MKTYQYDWLTTEEKSDSTQVCADSIGEANEVFLDFLTENPDVFPMGSTASVRCVYNEYDEDEYRRYEKTDEEYTIICNPPHISAFSLSPDEKGIILLDCGVLLMHTDRDYDAYRNDNYNSAFSLFDEGMDGYFEKDFKKCHKDAIDYVSNGVDRTYAIISRQGRCSGVEKEEDLDGIDNSWFDRKREDVVFSIAKINGKIVEDFLNKNIIL